MHKKRQGYVQVYTGDGKGKTTAALGLALRGAGHGLKTFIGQFLKRRDCGELRAVGNLKGSVLIEQFGSGKWHLPGQDPDPIEAGLARRGLQRIMEVLKSREFDIVVMDEVLVAVKFGLLREKDVLEVIQSRPAPTEVVLTGRGASTAIVEAADLVSEMREIKHYFASGVRARKGIEH